MICEKCGHKKSSCIEARDVESWGDNNNEMMYRRRRRTCLGCGERFTTYEGDMETLLELVSRKEFSRYLTKYRRYSDKLAASVKAAREEAGL